MVSFAYLLTLLSVLVSLTVAEEAGAAKSNSVDEKWLGLGVGLGVNIGFGPGTYISGHSYNRYANWLGGYPSFAACGLWSYNPRYSRSWFKEAGNSVARRSESPPINSDHLYPRGEGAVSCNGKDGVVQEITPSHCQKAIDNLISQKSSSASFGSCSITMATPSGKLAVTGAPAEALHNAASEILKACSANGTGETSSPAPQKVTRRSPAEAVQKSNKQFAMIISKNVASTSN
ncbi:hypothetical protein PCANC_02735 [Puccinia coronata f. sp. avenae]|uniref:Uncharacterized protein n=1 Tax=Puccinia coronata f. sp. avenae TaxID=200324 RepID=A0A2N5VYA5_9BASI|nr:hypothetical protein PCANC_02735 [Puccinia coronata f. sp. avenae]